ncbi:hypothetical protein FBALC1_08403 [Flavobacteriales bacterium ALC-1]|nr:hypothetical protein FBALC1_08403 [Flavobacteriales bacterium ALC-1]
MSRIVKLIFFVGLLCIIYTSFVVFVSQTGPSWEVPQSVMLHISFLPIICLIGLIMTFLSIRLKTMDGIKSHLITISILAFVLPMIIALIDIEQWPITYPTVSRFLKLFFLPVIIIISIVEFIYVMKRIKKK